MIAKFTAPVRAGRAMGLALGAFALAASVFAVDGALAESALEKGKDHVRIASWNLSNLHHEPGQSVPGRDVVRAPEDYTWLQFYAGQLNADLIALQEINSRAAGHSVLRRGLWTVEISGRRFKDFETFDLSGEWSSGSIYTGVGVRRGLEIIRAEDVPSLEVTHVDPRTGIARPTRWAKEVEVARNGHHLLVLAVHLKSGCFTGQIMDDKNGPDTFEHPYDADCTTAARQVAPLQAWIREKSEGDLPFIILGDFNRAFDVHGDKDHLWRALNEALPGRSTFTRFPDGETSTCWKNAPPAPYHEKPIDFILLDPRASEWAVPGSFGEVPYDKSLASHYRRISDHCPIYLDLAWPAAAGADGLTPVTNAADAAENLRRLNGEVSLEDWIKEADSPLADQLKSPQPR